MSHNMPLSPRPLHHLSDVQRRVLTTRQLREHGVTASVAAERSRADGPWQQLLPGVHLLHPGPATSEERLLAALLYTASRGQGADGPRPDGGPYGEAMITGLAALALRHFSSAPPLASLDHIDVLVPRTRRLRATGFVRFVRGGSLPGPQYLAGVPTAPVARALADAVARLTDAVLVRRLLTESVRHGHCEAAALVAELNSARLLSRPHVVDAVDALLAEGRAIAEGRLYDMVRGHHLPEPLWNVELRLPGGPALGGVDAYWREQAVAVEIDARAPRQDEEVWRGGLGRKREHLERLGITVVRMTPKKLRESPEEQAAVVRTALVAAADRDPASYVVVLPR
ncbi:hypothetical protein [Streptomyces malaysiensis]|uniref:DUF559 domain-containing protein n=1 Tax=Streptomyces autolyticus TaxID=75293 RepID=A0ABM6HCX8_9ACTN|nr:hypothetical protein [Streptomyces autolyticus]AQA11876.1 hypothetical protein BV401_16775 [Streptomyces autolyticus]MCC4316686.1 hypothetical protein [Streptomyces malaysiensis]